MNAHAHDLTRAQVAALMDECETLREMVRQYQTMLRPVVTLPTWWRLTEREAGLLSALRAAAPGVLHYERGIVALYGMIDDAPAEKILQAWMFRLRTKLRAARADITIENVRPHGYRLGPDACARFDAAVAEASAGYPDASQAAARTIAGAAHVR